MSFKAPQACKQQLTPVNGSVSRKLYTTRYIPDINGYLTKMWQTYVTPIEHRWPRPPTIKRPCPPSKTRAMLHWLLHLWQASRQGDRRIRGKRGGKAAVRSG